MYLSYQLHAYLWMSEVSFRALKEFLQVLIRMYLLVFIRLYDHLELI